jgi:hypothetical protein
MEEKNIIGNLTSAFMSIALAASMLSIVPSEYSLGVGIKNDELYIKDNFFKNKYRCSIVKKDSLETLKKIKRYY